MAEIRRTTRVSISEDRERGVFMISVAAELAEMHPQTLRAYESKGLISPRRSSKGTRLYSQADVERLRRIQEMTAELGLNLAGVAQVLELEDRLERARRRTAGLEARARELEIEVVRLEELRRELRAEIVPYERGGALVRQPQAAPATRIPIQRPSAAHDGDQADAGSKSTQHEQESTE